MSGGLDGAKRKVNWAEQHFSDFKAILFGRSSAINAGKTTILHYQPKRQLRRSPAHLIEPPPECRLALGDAVHQLRSSLDHLICALALRPSRGNAPTVCEDNRLEFPLHKESRDFTANWRVSQGVLETILGKDELTAIEESQPYNRNTTRPTHDPLWLLRELDNIDKHRTILVIDQRFSAQGTVGGIPFQIVKEKLVPGKKRFTVALPIPGPPEKVNVERSAIYVVFSETGLACDNITVFHTWRQMIDAVKDTISKFERFFP